ncbi:MAG: YwiC-like family protein [Ignavibacteriales bacterium]|nr:YwiC-like family protein [Ignavibacteriales bacterium]
MSIPKPIITKEHGAWAVLFVPMIAGAAYANSFSWNVVCLAFSALCVFMSYVPVHTLLREWTGTSQGEEKLAAAEFWTAVYLGCGVLLILPLLYEQLWLLLAIGIFGAGLFLGNFLLTRKIQKSIAGDLTAVAGLTLGAPGVYYAATGTLDSEAFVLWLLNFLFFGCSVFYVHLKIRVSKMKKDKWHLREKLSAGKMNILYHCLVVTVVVVLVLYHLTPATIVIAFLPMVVHAVVGTIRLSHRVKFKHLGLLLLGHSIVFGLIFVLMKH